MRTCKKCGEAKPLEMFSRKLAGYQTKCKPCCSVEHREWHQKNREKSLAAKKVHYSENREYALARQKAYYAEHREARLAYAEEWRKSNPDKIRDEYSRNAEDYRQRVKEWRQNNPEARRVQEVARRARLRWIPPWADRKAMAAIYEQAKVMRQLGVDVHVDHIIPLRGKTVSGLHVHNNLRLVLAEENLKKNARLVEELLA